MHPIVRDFINTGERITIILEKYPDKDQFLESIFLKLGQSINFENLDNQLYLDLDQAIINGHPDTEVYFLFISFAIASVSRRNQFERAKVLQSIGASLYREKTHPLLQAYYVSGVATLKFYEGQKQEGYQMLKESLSLADKNSPRYRTILYNAAVLIATMGRLNGLDEKDLRLIDYPTNEQHEYVCSEIKIANAIVLGEFQKKDELIQKNKMSFKGDNLYAIEARENLFNIISGDFNENNYQEKAFKLYANICNSLAFGKIEDAIKTYSLCLNFDWKNSIKLPFSEYFPLHFQLGLRNKGMARLLLLEIMGKGNVSYFDDFFLARIQLLEMNKEGAIESFRRLMNNINRFGAMKRLTFELQFARELEPSDIMILMNSAVEEEVVVSPTVKKEESVQYKIVAKGVQLLIGSSSANAKVKELIQKFAILKEPVLIIGETGTGKELVARAIHEEGPNPKAPFLAINCGALTESLLQSELFGYVAGAFTGAQKERKGIFEAAGKGTVFLDEFGDIGPAMQMSLLRVLESNEIRLIGGTKSRLIECKIVIATNNDLQSAVQNKKFREDLYFRLTRFDIKLPPLRERKEDIPQIIDYFLKTKKATNEIQQVISKELLDVLTDYRWSGNIRELKNEIERLKILYADKEILNREDFDFTRLQGFAPNIPVQKAITKENEAIAENLFTKELNISKEQILKIVQRGSIAENRERIFKELFQKYKKLTRSQIIEIININPGTASKELRSLCDHGFIRKLMPTKSVKSHYFELVE